MNNQNKFGDPFWECVNHANDIANRILRSHPGGFTNEDVVGAFIEKQVKRGAGQVEIEKIMQSPFLRKYLENSKNDLWRGETALKRGNGMPVAPLEKVEHFHGSDNCSPETLLIEKEKDIETSNFLVELFKSTGISETQWKILELDMKGKSSEEIAGILKTDIKTVYTRRSEAMRKLSKTAKRVLDKRNKGE